MSLDQIRKNVYLADLGPGRIVDCIKRFASGDAVIIFSFPRYIPEALGMAGEARRAGCTLLGVSDSASSPLTLQSDLYLVAPYAGVSFFNSPAAPLALVSALVTQVVNMLGEESRAELDRFLDIQNRWTEMVDDVEAIRIGGNIT